MSAERLRNYRQTIKDNSKDNIDYGNVSITSPRREPRFEGEVGLQDAYGRHLCQEVQKDAKSKEYDVTKTAGYREAMDDVKHGRVTHYDSLKDFYKEMGL